MGKGRKKPYTEIGIKQKTDNDSASTPATGDLMVSVKEYTVGDLWQQAWSLAGKSLFYMQFLHAEDNMFDEQAIRIEQMCYHLAAEWRNHLEEIDENKQWFRDWIEKFEDEVENQC